MISPRFAMFGAAVIVTLLAGFGDQPALAGGPTNDGSHYRYPWTPWTDPSGASDTLRSVTQGQQQGGHQAANGDEYAVDWIDGSGWFAYAANAGKIQCRFDGLHWGYFAFVYDPLVGQSSIYAHLVNCWFWSSSVPADIEQGQFVGVTDDTGHSEGNYLHFQVMAGNPPALYLDSIPFTMDGQSSFTGPETDGPSDDVGVGYVQLNPLTADSVIVNQYRTAGGGTPAAWWNVGASYATPVGPCVYINTAFVHSCPTLAGTFTVQDCIRWDGLRSALAKDTSGANAYRISGQDWMLMGTSFRNSGSMTNQLGPPASNESGGGITSQYFAYGTVNRYTARVRQDVFLFGGIVWRATYYFQSNGDTCVDVDGSGDVGFSDLILLARYYGTDEYGPPNSGGNYYTPLVDFDRDGSVGASDLQILALQYNKVCQY